eukprot:scaffold252347_cov20-Tisochrysis_lutea.AAC.2
MEVEAAVQKPLELGCTYCYDNGDLPSIHNSTAVLHAQKKCFQGVRSHATPLKNTCFADQDKFCMAFYTMSPIC